MSAAAVESKVIIIGAGPGGLCAAIRLREAGVEDVVILEKTGGVGGTWNLNRYPGAECDIRSHLYSYSFELNPNWSRPYSGQEEILAYLEHCADKYGVRALCRFDASVAQAVWDEDAGLWTLRCEDGRVFKAPLVIGAVGMFSEVSIPEIDGLAGFKGEMFHSARWNPQSDLRGRRVAVIGSAASAVQLIPEIAPEVEQLYVYQRSPNWVLPKEDQPYSPDQVAAFRDNPAAMPDLRKEIFDGVEIQRAYMTKAGSEKVRQAQDSGLKHMMAVKDPVLRNKLVPNYPLGCRRILLSNVYYPTFNRDNVELVTDPIARIGERAIETADGMRREVDAIVFATGFNTMRYITAIDVVGAGGARLRDAWADGPQAYRGVAVSGFPNLFMLYGPNTNIGSVIYMIEAQVDYIVRWVQRFEREGLGSLEVRAEAQGEYNDRVQGVLDELDIWVSGCTNYFRHPVSGRVVTQWPLTMGEYAEWMRRPDEEAYDLRQRTSAPEKQDRVLT
jgi:cation diffusion facilitator CzcD-associated flavoprotein CzcO